MEALNQIETYLVKYWEKYPNEIPNDPTLEEVKDYIKAGGEFHLNDNIFILYSDGTYHAEIIFYWCDMGNESLGVVRDTLKRHKSFMSTFNVPVYSRSIKELFTRGYLGKQENNLWRWL